MAPMFKLLLLGLMATAAFSGPAVRKSKPRDMSNLDFMVRNIQAIGEQVPEFKALMDKHDAFFKDVYEQDGKAPEDSDEIDVESASLTDFDQCGSQPPSVTAPTSAHRVRPADIQHIGAIGDSLTAANGAKSWTLITVIREYRGVSANVGSGKRYDNVITLASMLRELNDDLHGYSTGTGKVDNENVAQFNLAEPGNEAWDMPRQARNLIERMKNDPMMDLENDWKMITVFIGGNDMCTYCTDRGFYQPSEYIAYIQEALDMFHAELPRTIVNILPLFDMSLVTDISNNIGCGLVHMMVCPCKPKTDEEVAEVSEWSYAYRVAVEDLVASRRYDTNEDFTVISQPMLTETTPPLKENGEYDMSYWAPDCFHFSEKSHKAAGQALWNNLIEPVGGKTHHWMLDEPVKCTTQEQPYIATNLNSENGEWLPRD